MLRTTKRLKKEIELLKERYLLLDEDLIEFNNYFHLVIKPIENNKKYLIEMDKSTFPFKPPNIFLLHGPAVCPSYLSTSIIDIPLLFL